MISYPPFALLCELLAECESDPRGIPRNPIRELHLPLAFAAVHSEHNGSFAWRIVTGCFDEKEIRPHLRDADRFALDDQLHLDLGRMGTITLFRDHERNPDS